MSPEFESKVEGYRHRLRSNGVGDWRGGILIHAVFWKIGIPLKPPVFMSWGADILLGAIYLPLVLYPFLWLDATGFGSHSLEANIPVAQFAFIGAALGVLFRKHDRARATSYGIPDTWEECGASEPSLEKKKDNPSPE